MVLATKYIIGIVFLIISSSVMGFYSYDNFVKGDKTLMGSIKALFDFSDMKLNIEDIKGKEKSFWVAFIESEEAGDVTSLNCEDKTYCFIGREYGKIEKISKPFGTSIWKNSGGNPAPYGSNDRKPNMYTPSSISCHKNFCYISQNKCNSNGHTSGCSTYNQRIGKLEKDDGNIIWGSSNIIELEHVGDSRKTKKIDCKGSYCYVTMNTGGYVTKIHIGTGYEGDPTSFEYENSDTKIYDGVTNNELFCMNTTKNGNGYCIITLDQIIKLPDGFETERTHKSFITMIPFEEIDGELENNYKTLDICKTKIDDELTKLNESCPTDKDNIIRGNRMLSTYCDNRVNGYCYITLALVKCEGALLTPAPCGGDVGENVGNINNIAMVKINKSDLSSEWVIIPSDPIKDNIIDMECDDTDCLMLSKDKIYKLTHNGPNANLNSIIKIKDRLNADETYKFIECDENYCYIVTYKTITETKDHSTKTWEQPFFRKISKEVLYK